MANETRLTPAVLLVLLNAWECVPHGTTLEELAGDIVRKGGSDAIVALGFPVEVAVGDRTLEVVRAAVMTCVAEGWCEVRERRPAAGKELVRIAQPDDSVRLVPLDELAEFLTNDEHWHWSGTSLVEVVMTDEGWDMGVTGEFVRQYLARYG